MASDLLNMRPSNLSDGVGTLATDAGDLITHAGEMIPALTPTSYDALNVPAPYAIGQPPAHSGPTRLDVALNRLNWLIPKNQQGGYVPVPADPSAPTNPITSPKPNVAGTPAKVRAFWARMFGWPVPTVPK